MGIEPGMRFFFFFLTLLTNLLQTNDIPTTWRILRRDSPTSGLTHKWVVIVTNRFGSIGDFVTNLLNCIYDLDYAVVTCQVALQYTTLLDTSPTILLHHNSIRNGLWKFNEIADFFRDLKVNFTWLNFTNATGLLLYSPETYFPGAFHCSRTVGILQ